MEKVRLHAKCAGGCRRFAAQPAKREFDAYRRTVICPRPNAAWTPSLRLDLAYSRTIRRTIVSVILFWGSLTEHAGNAQISRGNNPWGNAGFNGPSDPLAETHRRGPRNEASHHAFSHSLLVYRGCPRLHGCSVTFVNAKRRSFIFHFSGPHTSKQAHTPFDLFYKAFSRQSS